MSRLFGEGPRQREAARGEAERLAVQVPRRPQRRAIWRRRGWPRRARASPSAGAPGSMRTASAISVPGMCWSSRSASAARGRSKPRARSSVSTRENWIESAWSRESIIVVADQEDRRRQRDGERREGQAPGVPLDVAQHHAAGNSEEAIEPQPLDDRGLEGLGRLGLHGLRGGQAHRPAHRRERPEPSRGEAGEDADDHRAGAHLVDQDREVEVLDQAREARASPSRIPRPTPSAAPSPQMTSASRR